MQRNNIFILIFTVMLICGCKIPASNPVKIEKPELEMNTDYQLVTEDLLENDFAILEGNHLSFGKERFEYFSTGAKVEFEVMATDNYSRVYLRSTDKQQYLFSNVKCSPKPEYITQTQYPEGQPSYEITKIALYNDSKIYKVTIIMNLEEAEFLKNNGLMFTGNNYVIKSVTLTYGKSVQTATLSFAEQYELYSEYRNSIIEKYSKQYNTPMIFITTENREEVIKKEYYTSMVDVVNCSENFKLSKKGQVKVRGNSTASDEWSPDVKPYRIKFDSKQNMLGLHGGKKYKSWVLLKAGGFNAADYLGFNLAHEIYKTSSLGYYASDCAFVHVFVNENYKGVYLLCEQNQVNEGRVAVEENKAGSKDVKTGYTIELDNYAWEDLKDGQGRWFGDNCSQGNEDYHFGLKYLSDDPADNISFQVWGSEQTGVKLTDINGETRGVQNDDFTLKSDIYSDDQVIFIHKYMKNLWNICYEAIEKNHFCKFDENYDMVEAPELTSAEEVCAAIVDLESLCNEMILEELVRDNDVGAGSLYMAIDFTKDQGQKYNKFTFECPWDFNWAYQPVSSDKDNGAYWKGKTQYFAGGWQTVELLEDKYDRSHPWFILFNNAPWFRKMLRDKWNEINPDNLRNVTFEADKEVSSKGKDIGGASCQWITDFVRNRIDYIDKYLWK